MLFISALLGGCISFFISAIFKESAYFLITFFALIILNVQILSLFKGITGENILILTAVEIIPALYFWIKKKKPLLKINFPVNEFKNALIKDKSLLFLFAVWLFFICGAFLLAAFSPVTEPDAHCYHALRALFWAKDGFISHFEGADVRNACLAINSELFYVWVYTLFKKDSLFGLLNFLFYFQLIFCSYKIMELFNIDFIKRIWAILIFSSFPIVIVQISSTQTDLTVGALLVSSIYFVLKYKNNPSNSLLYFAALAAGVSFGVKTTALMAAIPLFLWFILILKKDFIKFFLLVILNSFVFSGYNYILNFIEFGDFFTSSSFYIYNKSYGGFKGFISNIIKYGFQFIDFTGINPGEYICTKIIYIKDSLLNALSIPLDLCEIDSINRVNIYLHEGSGGFGITGFLVFIPCLLVSLFKKNLRIFSCLFFLPFLILCLLMAYSIFCIRYFLCFVSLSIPVLTVCYFKKMNLYKFVVIFLAAFYMIFAALYSPARPLGYLIKEYAKGTLNIQNKMRNHEYKFFGPYLNTESGAFRSSVLPYCKNGNKIAIFAPSINLLYSAKYLEINNDCKIDTLNMLHINNYNLKDYNAIILNKAMEQTSNYITKKDIDNPILTQYPVFCSYVLSDKSVKTGLKSAVEAKCILNENFIKTQGFELKNEYFYLLQDKKTNLQNTDSLNVWVKK